MGRDFPKAQQRVVLTSEPLWAQFFYFPGHCTLQDTLLSLNAPMGYQCVPGQDSRGSHSIPETDNDQGWRQPEQSTQAQSKAFTQCDFSLFSFRCEFTCFQMRISQEKPKPLLPGSLAITAMPHWETLNILDGSPLAGLRGCTAAGGSPAGRGR